MWLLRKCQSAGTFRPGWRRNLTILFFRALSILSASLVGFLFLSFLVQLLIQSAQLARRWRHWNNQKLCLYRSPPGNCRVLQTRLAQVGLILPCTDSHENGVKNKHFPPLHFSLLFYFCCPGLQSWCLCRTAQRKWSHYLKGTDENRWSSSHLPFILLLGHIRKWMSWFLNAALASQHDFTFPGSLYQNF